MKMEKKITYRFKFGTNFISYTATDIYCIAMLYLFLLYVCMYILFFVAVHHWTIEQRSCSNKKRVMKFKIKPKNVSLCFKCVSSMFNMHSSMQQLEIYWVRCGKQMERRENRNKKLYLYVSSITIHISLYCTNNKIKTAP